MNLLSHITKAVRWVASSISGKKGRDIVDKYGPALETCLSVLVPTLNMDDKAMARAAIEDWAKDRGVPLEDLKGFVDAVQADARKASHEPV
jgi:hypothetical protein